MKVLCTPNTEEVENYINKRIINDMKKILHIVPTMILYRRRRSFYINYLKKKRKVFIPDNASDQEIDGVLKEHNIFLFEFNRFIRHIVQVNFSNRHVLSRREASIILERVVKNNPKTNNYVWRLTISKIYEFFQTLTIAGIDIQKIRQMFSNEAWIDLLTIYEKYIEEINRLGFLDLAMAFRKAVELEDFSAYDEIYIDGAFLPIQPALHQIIIRLKNISSNILFFIPYDFNAKDSPAFRILKKTYLPYVPYEKWISINKDIEQHNVVNKLARKIFTSETIDKIDDNSFQIRKFETMEEEFHSIVSEIAMLVRQGVVPHHKIAIVTPNPMEMRPYVRELAELYQVQCEVPEKPLIQLPLGKFIFLLYQIMIDEKARINGLTHYIDAQMVKELLHLQVVKNSQNVINTYEKIEAFFIDCMTFDCWFKKIQHLLQAKENIYEKYRHHPIYYLKTEELLEFKSFLSLIQQFTNELFSVKKGTFKEHFANILNFLKAKDNLLLLEQDVMRRLHEIADYIDDDNILFVDIEEFAIRVQSLLNDEILIQVEKAYRTKQQVKITVTGPNNVEYQKYDYIYLTRFTQNMYPEKIEHQWPMSLDLESFILDSTTSLSFKNNRELFHYYLDRELYHLFLVINAVKKKLTISYSKKVDGIKQSVSHYLHDIAKVFNIEEDLESDKKIEDILKDKKFLKRTSSKYVEYSPSDGNSKVMDPIDEGLIFTIEDIAVYEYCPRRFYYETKYPDRNIYTDIFHLQHYAVACLYEESVKILTDRFHEISKESKKKLFREMDEIINHAQDRIFSMFPFGLRIWDDIKMRTKFHLEQLVETILINTEHNRAKISLNGQEVVKKVDGYTFKGERRLRVKYPTITHYYPISNLKSFLSFSVNVQEPNEIERLKQIKEKYKDLLRDFCYKKNNIDEKLSYFISKINNLEFEKRPGGHCLYCVFESVCMEKEILHHATNN